MWPQAVAQCNLGDGVFSVNANGTILTASEECCRLFNRPEKTMVGQSILLLFRTDEASGLRFVQQRVTQRNSYVDAITGTGNTFRGALAMAEARSATNRFFVGVLRDITAEELLKMEQVKTQKLMEGLLLSSVALITLSTDGTIRGANGGALKVFGYAEEELLGRSVSMLMTEVDAVRHDHFVRHYIATGVGKIMGRGREVLGLSKTGKVLPLHLTVTEVKTPKDHFFTGIIMDLTQQKEAQKAKVFFFFFVSA
jgi:PAS domain S-box-containing protein